MKKPKEVSFEGADGSPNDKQESILGIKFPKIEINGKNPSSVAKIKVKLNEINETK